MIQIIIALLIILLGFLVFYFYPIKFSVKEITLSAMFIVVTLICKRFFTVLIPLFGVESFKIGIEYIPLMIAGFLLLPSNAFIIGLCCDLIGLIIVPTGFPFFGFTLTMICVAVIPSVISHSLVKLKASHIIWMTRILLLAIVGSAIVYISHISSFKVSDTVVSLTSTNKIILDIILVMIVMIVFGVIHLISNRLSEEELKTFSTWCLSVILVECFCTLFLTPLWLSIMYSIPFVTSLCIRVIKEVFILPLELFAGYIILKTLKRVLHNSLDFK